MSVYLLDRNKFNESLIARSSRTIRSDLENLISWNMSKSSTTSQEVNLRKLLNNNNNYCLLLEASFSRSKAVHDKLKYYLDLLLNLSDELGDFSRMKPEYATEASIVCPFRMPVIRKDIQGQRGLVRIIGPEFSKRTNLLMESLQILHLSVLGIASFVFDQLQTYLRYHIREDSLYLSDKTGSPFDGYGINELRMVLRPLWNLLKWLRMTARGYLPTKVGYVKFTRS
jgi:hypothetical protein